MMKNKQKGEIATIVTLGTLLVLGVSTLISSMLLNDNKNKQTTKTKAAESCFTPSANVELRQEGNKKAFYVSVKINSSKGGHVYLDYNGIRIAGPNSFAGGSFTYGPEWTQPFSQGKFAAGVAAFPNDQGVNEVIASYLIWHDACAPEQTKTITCTVGVNGDVPYMKGDSCTATNFDANASLSQSNNSTSQGSSSAKVGDICRYPQEDLPGVVNCYEGNIDTDGVCRWKAGLSTGKKISCSDGASAPTATPTTIPTTFKPTVTVPTAPKPTATISPTSKPTATIPITSQPTVTVPTTKPTLYKPAAFPTAPKKIVKQNGCGAFTWGCPEYTRCENSQCIECGKNGEPACSGVGVGGAVINETCDQRDGKSKRIINSICVNCGGEDEYTCNAWRAESCDPGLDPITYGGQEICTRFKYTYDSQKNEKGLEATKALNYACWPEDKCVSFMKDMNKCSSNNVNECKEICSESCIID